MMKIISLLLILFFSVSATFENCTFKGKKVYGRVRVVDIGEDFKVRIVDIGEDIRIKKTDFSPQCGEWKFVDIGEDFKVRIVDIGEDFKIRFVDFRDDFTIKLNK